MNARVKLGARVAEMASHIRLRFRHRLSSGDETVAAGNYARNL